MKPVFLKLQNFKSIGVNEQQIDLAPITLLFGPNSAGKSTILQALIYLREILLNRNYDPDKTVLGGDWLDLGGFRNLVHGRDMAQSIRIEVGFERENDELSDYLTDTERDEIESFNLDLPENYLERVTGYRLAVSIRWSSVLGRPIVEALETWLNGKLFSKIISSIDGKQVYLEQLNLAHPVLENESIDAEDNASNLTFGEMFGDTISTLAGTEIGEAALALFSHDRPFSIMTIEGLEETVHGQWKGNRKILEQVAEELKHRSSRRASKLKKIVVKKLEILSEQQQELGFIGLTGQMDALPNERTGIQLDSSIWRDEDVEMDSEGNELAFRLLSKGLLSGLIVGPVKQVSHWLKNFSYIGPIRDLPPRNFQPQISPDKSRWSNGMAAWESLHRLDEKHIKEINFWLGEKGLNTGYQVAVHKYREVPLDTPLASYLERDGLEYEDMEFLKGILVEYPVKTRISLVEEDTGLELMPQDVGVGISQVFPVVVLTIIQNSGLIAIEQPELHIHPAIQTELADLFARYAIEHNKIMLLETHSEHIILRLLRRIREVNEDSNINRSFDQISRDTVSVQYVEPSSTGTKFKRLRIDDEGDFLDEWPNGFFEERDEELFF